MEREKFRKFHKKHKGCKEVDGFDQVGAAQPSRLKVAASYVDLSRLELALRGLETSHPTVRVALLGLNGLTATRKLARTLLADPLNPTLPWEKALETGDFGDDGSLLIRFGDEAAPMAPRASVNVQHVPSAVLQRNNIELLISTTPAASLAASPAQFEATALVPMVGTPMSFSGNVSFIRHPVHQAVILADGLAGCVNLGVWTQRGDAQQRDLVSVATALNMSRFDARSEDNLPRDLILIDTDRAVESIDLLQTSVENAPNFAAGWKASGVPKILDWLLAGTQTQRSGMIAAVRTLIDDILDRADRALEADRTRMATRVSTTLFATRTAALEESLTKWAIHGHGELRDSLERVLVSRDWKKLQWWKLFWRVDDVGITLGRVTADNWLKASERSLIWLEGRFAEAGLADQHDTDDFTATKQDVVPRPFAIEKARQQVLSESLPALEALSQTLVLQSASVTLLSSTFAVLIALSWPAFGLMQAGAVAALGLTWSLRRMQVKWEDARESWIEELRERGRQSLRHAEEGLRVRLAAGVVDSSSDVQMLPDLEEAAATIEKAKTALHELESNQGSA
ncbi:MAG: hypothetical protein Q9159_004593 [Coniocarpon cinnabarinum]